MTVLSIHVVAEQHGVSEATVRSWVMRGHLEPIRRGARPLMFWEHDVERYLSDRMGDREHERLDALWSQVLAVNETLCHDRGTPTHPSTG